MTYVVDNEDEKEVVSQQSQNSCSSGNGEASLSCSLDASSESAGESIWQYSEEDLQNMKPRVIKDLLRKAGLSESGSKERLIATYIR